jgi:hypothetical protein
MAIVIEANYTKKLGLPGYSSHQYSVTLRTELANLNQVEAESTRPHTLLQSSVDREIQKVGFLPDKGNGNGNHDVWNCSPKQRQYIIDLVDQNRLDKTAVEQLAQDRFGKSVRGLNRLEASGLIEELKEQVARNGQAPAPQNGRANQPAGAR